MSDARQREHADGAAMATEAIDALAAAPSVEASDATAEGASDVGPAAVWPTEPPYDSLFDPPERALDPGLHVGPAVGAASSAPTASAGYDAGATGEAAAERYFLLKFVAIVAVAIALGAVGVWKVQERSSGIRTAAQLAKVDDERRDVIELNRRLEAAIVGELNPVKLRRVAEEEHQMRVPDPEDQVEVP